MTLDSAADNDDHGITPGQTPPFWELEALIAAGVDSTEALRRLAIRRADRPVPPMISDHLSRDGFTGKIVWRPNASPEYRHAGDWRELHPTLARYWS